MKSWWHYKINTMTPVVMEGLNHGDPAGKDFLSPNHCANANDKYQTVFCFYFLI